MSLTETEKSIITAFDHCYILVSNIVTRLLVGGALSVTAIHGGGFLLRKE